MNAILDKQQHIAPTPASIWDERYEKEGHIWGDEPSMTARLLTKKLEEPSAVLEIGCGYGRDLIELVHQGHRATGVEKSKVAITLAENDNQLDEFINNSRAFLLRGDFAGASLGKGSFDAVMSHRVLHLLGNNGLVRAFQHHASRVLKPGGLLLVSARNDKDFNSEQMVERGQGAAEYKNRPGHLIRFWNEALFRETFSDNFEIIDFVDGTEIESVQNTIDTHFTLMIARKKPSSLQVI